MRIFRALFILLPSFLFCQSVLANTMLIQIRQINPAQEFLNLFCKERICLAAMKITPNLRSKTIKPEQINIRIENENSPIFRFYWKGVQLITATGNMYLNAGKNNEKQTVKLYLPNPLSQDEDQGFLIHPMVLRPTLDIVAELEIFSISEINKY